MGAAEVGELPLVEVDDGPLEVVGAVVEEEQHGGADELRPELGERARVDRLEEDLQALDRLVHVRAERHHHARRLRLYDRNELLMTIAR